MSISCFKQQSVFVSWYVFILRRNGGCVIANQPSSILSQSCELVILPSSASLLHPHNMEPEPDPPSFPRIKFAENMNISHNLVSEYTRHAFCCDSHCKRFAFCPYSTSCCDECLRGQHSVASSRRQIFIEWHQIFPVVVRAMDDRVRPQGYVRMHTLPSDKCTTAECCRAANMDY